MCNLYSLTKSQDAIRYRFAVTKDSAGSMPSLPGIFPNDLAPVVRVGDDGRELNKMHWGMPNPPQFGGSNTNIRNAGSPHWRRWMKPETRCSALGSCDQLFGIRARTRSGHEEEGHHLVRTLARSAPVCLCRHLDGMDRQTGSGQEPHC